MNEEIKDLLQMIKTCSKNLDAKLTLDSGCCKCLLEYIDGLKERIEYLERSNNRREITIQEEREENLELHNKIDKAIEYINEFPLVHYSSIEKIDGKRLSGKLVPVDELLEILKDSDVDE